MGFEFAGCPSPILNQHQLDLIRREFAKEPFLSIVRDEGNQLGIVFKNEEKTSGWNELVTVALTTDKIYVVFHVNNHDQQVVVVEALHRIWTSIGVTCHLGEL